MYAYNFPTDLQVPLDLLVGADNEVNLDPEVQQAVPVQQDVRDLRDHVAHAVLLDQLEQGENLDQQEAMEGQVGEGLPNFKQLGIIDVEGCCYVLCSCDFVITLADVAGN